MQSMFSYLRIDYLPLYSLSHEIKSHLDFHSIVCCSIAAARGPISGEKWVSGIGHSHLRSFWIHYQINQRDGVNSSPPLGSPPNFHNESRTVPGALFILVVLAFLFLVCGLAYFLVRFLTKNSSSSSTHNFVPSNSDAIEGQLQQLFHLDDSGLDQVFIDSLPVFRYKEIVGPEKEPFDCAVCLCEFLEDDELRLIPICGHAFHIKCIDTWLLSNSTCPLCRGTLLSPGLTIGNLLFDSDYDYLWEEDENNAFASVQKRVEDEEVEMQKGIFPVRLGKFQKLNNVETGVRETSSSKLDFRRCYSMGSYQYVVGDYNLRVALPNGNIMSGNEPSSVEGKKICVGDSNLKVGLHDVKVMIENEQASVEGKKICVGGKTDSYSVSKIWLWSKKRSFTSSPGSLNLVRVDRT